MSFHFDWSQATSLAAVISAIVAIVSATIATIALIFESRRSRLALSVELVMKLDERFFASEEMRRNRLNAANGIRARKYEETDDVFNFFATVGLLLRRHALDEEMVWCTFAAWVRNYHYLARDYVRNERMKDPTAWQNLEYLVGRLEDCDKKRCKSVLPHIPTDLEIKEFLEGEVEAGSGLPHAVPDKVPTPAN